jgi:cytidyltransferase-like protein
MKIRQNDLSKFTAEERKNCVLCFGCFDILHIGHILYFEKLKTLKPTVVVGLFNDASVSFSKGPERPILPEQERLKILDALKNIDYVFVQEPGNVDELIKKYNVKGKEAFIWENCIYPISLLKPDVVTVSTDFKLTEKIYERYFSTLIIEKIEI